MQSAVPNFVESNSTATRPTDDQRATVTALYAVGVREPALEGFDDLFRDEYDSIVRAVYLVTGDRATASEVTQDAFTQAVVHWRKVRRYDKPGAWVRRVAIRQAVKVRRRDDKRDQLMALAANETLHPSTTTETSQQLDAALDTLSPKQRAMVVLHYFDGLSVNEAASVLGCRSATASVHLHRARNRLGAELASAATGFAADEPATGDTTCSDRDCASKGVGSDV